MRVKFTGTTFTCAIALFCLTCSATAQTRRNAPYDFFSDCNDSKQIGEAVSLVRTDPFKGQVFVDVKTPYTGGAYGRAGAGIFYTPDFTGTARVDALIRINPSSLDFISLLSFHYSDIPITPGFVSVRSHAYVNVKGGKTAGVENTNQFRYAELSLLNALGTTNWQDLISPFDYERMSYNPAKEVSVSVVTGVNRGETLRICGGIQSKVAASSLFPFNTIAKGFYEGEVLQITVTPLADWTPPPPAPRATPAPTPAPTPVQVRPSVFVIKKNDTGVGTTEAHVLSGPDMFSRFVLNTGTAQHATGEEYVFRVADWDRDGQPDIFIIKKNGTGTGSTEVHILSGAGSYQKFLLNTGTPQHETWYEYDFQVADWDRDGYQDIIIIKKYNTGTNSTEVHVLSGVSKFQQFILHTGTPQEETGGGNYDFDMGDRDRDGYPDLFIIKKNGTGTGTLEVHVLSGASDFQRFILNTGTAQHTTGNEYVFRVADWDGDGIDDLFGIKKNQTGTSSTEVHILSGATNFQQFLLHTGTVQQETGENYDFEVARVKTYDAPAPIGNPLGRESQAPSFRAAAGLISASLSANQSTPVAVSVANSGGALSGAITDVEIIDASRRKVWQQIVENQIFVAGESKSYAFTWTPLTSGTYQIKIGVFAANWSPLLYWNDNAATVSVSGVAPTPTPTPTPTPSPSNELQIWWPSDGAQMSGIQPFKAMLTNLPIENYRAYWQVDGGMLNELGNSYSDYPHKESTVDLTGWTWRGAGLYQIRFVATDFSGAVLAERTVRIRTTSQ